jgi:hypothetical protein
MIWLVCSKCGVKEFVKEDNLQEHTYCPACKLGKMVFDVDSGIVGDNFPVLNKVNEISEIKELKKSDISRISKKDILEFVIDLNTCSFD